MARQPHGLSRYETLSKHCADHPQPPLPDTFGRIGHRNPVSGIAPGGAPFDTEKLLHAFDHAVSSMEDTSDPTGHDVAAGMTFFGQFVDHDVTLDATSVLGSVIDPTTIQNLRTPTLDLDCIYGDGPEGSPMLYHPDHHGYLLFGTTRNPLDLARTSQGTALIGDPRNDENQIVSQLQGAFICLHNIVMTALEEDGAMASKALEGIRAAAIESFGAKEEKFQVARRICRLHYQHMVMHDLLEAFVDPKVLKSVKDTMAAGDLPKGFDHASAVMPVEFSGAAYRFGHATVQSKYVLSDHHPAFDLFELGRPEFSFRPEGKNIDFNKLFDYPGNDKFQAARPIGRSMASAIFTLPFIMEAGKIGDVQMTLEQTRKLPLRNLLRDRLTLEIASGQQMARKMGFKEIAAPKELTKHGITKTPLWYYCLQEAEKHGGRLGQVGGTIVATVLMRLLYLDPDSVVCSVHDFKPWTELGATKGGNYSMGHMLKFVEANRGKIAHTEDLRTLAPAV